ncbi:MAG: 3-keto-disaccharide hydrolase [Actinomycetota bacterium]
MQARRRELLRIAVGAGLICGLGWAGRPCAAPAPEAFTDPAKAGPEYALQGEFVGTLGEKKLGAQVIALGSGAFQAAFHHGGLPGAGWDGKARVRVDGKLVGEAVAFEGSSTGWSAHLTEGKLTGQTADGAKFALSRVERASPTAGLKPPPGAVVLFDGTNADAWVNGKMSADGLLEAGTRTRQEFQDFTLHVEFRTPFKPAGRGQSRGNSGLYLLYRYEVQILDSFGLDGVFNECGAIYRQKAPDVNMCLPPLAWQTYDIDFQAARWDAAGTRTRQAVITIRHNGVPVHQNYEITGPTGGAARRPEAGERGPISFQNHGNPVMLRNVWILEK